MYIPIYFIIINKTRAELVTIQMCLLTLPMNVSANIMTDSQVSIDTINKSL